MHARCFWTTSLVPEKKIEQMNKRTSSRPIPENKRINEPPRTLSWQTPYQIGGLFDAAFNNRNSSDSFVPGHTSHIPENKRTEQTNRTNEQDKRTSLAPPFQTPHQTGELSDAAFASRNSSDCIAGEKSTAPAAPAGSAAWEASGTCGFTGSFRNT